MQFTPRLSLPFALAVPAVNVHRHPAGAVSGEGAC